MSFLNKFKKEFQELNVGERLQGQPQGTGPNAQNYSAPPPPAYGYGHQYQTAGPYQNQYPIAAEGHHYQAQHGASHDGTAPQQPHLPSTVPGPGPTYAGHQHGPQQPSLSPSPAGNPYVHPPMGGPAPYNSAPHVSNSVPCPTPPRWVPYWSEHSRRWYYVETTGRSSWEPPHDLHPLPAMPAYAGITSWQGHEAQPVYDQGAQSHIQPNPPTPRPGPGPDGGNKKGSSQTMLAAAGGFVAGGVAGYFTHDALDKRKKKKRHGRNPADFSDFAAYPAMELDLECNFCDQAISGPYAHCAKCDRGDWDVCRDCLAQGVTCEGGGKHRLVKVYPKYWCNGCDQLIRGDFYHCAICDKGDWDMCQRCLDRGQTCRADGGHQLARLYIPEPRFGSAGQSGNADSGSSSDES